MKRITSLSNAIRLCFVLSTLLLIIVKCEKKTDPPVPAPFIAELCKDESTFEMPNECLLVNSQWGKGDIDIKSFSQCIFKSTFNNITNYGWNWDWPNPLNSNRYGKVKAYPHILYGRNPHTPISSRISTTQKLPVLINSITGLTVQYKSTSSYTSLLNQYDLAFDLWLTSSKTPDATNIKYEIMIFEDKSLMPLQNPLNIVGTFTYEGIIYDLIKYITEDSPSWQYLAFIPHSSVSTSARTLDIMPFLNYLRTNNHISANDYLTDYLCNVSFGNEIWEGSGATTIYNYAVDLKSTSILGLVAYYPFNGNTNDESGNGHNGSGYKLVNIPDRFGNKNAAFYYSGDAEVDVPNNNQMNFNTNDDFSISTWLKVDSVQLHSSYIDNYIIGKWSGWLSEGYPYCLRCLNQSNKNDNGKINIGRWDGSKGPHVVSTKKINDGKWHHIVFLNNSKNITLYIDAQSEGTIVDNTQNSTSNNSNIFIGGSGSVGYSGGLDDTRFYNRSLTVEEIQQLYHEGGWQ
jgi:hypothetical protein